MRPFSIDFIRAGPCRPGLSGIYLNPEFRIPNPVLTAVFYRIRKKITIIYRREAVRHGLLTTNKVDRGQEI